MPDGLRGPVQGRALMGVSEGLEVGVSEWSRLEPGTRRSSDGLVLGRVDTVQLGPAVCQARGSRQNQPRPLLP